jgi:hypothetical protein
MIQHFFILCERCTGSHFLQYAMTENFKIKYLNRHHTRRHFFGHENDVSSYTEEEKQSTLFIVLVRNAVDWVDSFFKRKHHVPPINKNDIERFLKHEWYSIYETGDQLNTEIMEDRNIYTKERYRNLLELRKVKHQYLMSLETNGIFPHVLVLRYEDLRDDFENTMKSIQFVYNLQRLRPEETEYKKIHKYKGTYTLLYQKKPILLSEPIQEYIRSHVDKEQELELGYLV